MMHHTTNNTIRTLVFILMLLLSLGACSSKDDSLEEPIPADGAAAEEPVSNIANGEQPQTTEHEAGEPSEENPSPYVELYDQVPEGPLAAIQLKDGTQYEIIKFEKLGKYYIYISGKLNGRSSTVISLTRFQDLQKWNTIEFQDQYNFVITTRAGKKLNFLNSRMYIGSSSYDTFSFYVADGMNDQLVEVNKNDVVGIMFAPPQEEEAH